MIYPGRFDFTIEQRADFDRSFRLLDATGDTLDFTGYTLSAALWTPRRVKVVDFGFAWIDQAAAEFTLTLSPSVTTALSGAYIWDLLSVTPEGVRDYLLRGDAIAEPGYTV